MSPTQRLAQMGRFETGSQDNTTPVKGDILVFDDDVLSLQTLSRMLEQQGYEVRRA